MTIRFGPFVFDALRRDLRRDGASVHLTPKAFDLLSILVGDAPRVVPKAELHDRLWPGTFVSDAALVSLVKELRRALDDRDPEAPIVRTAHRVGYAFCLDVQSDRPNATAAACHWLVVSGRRIVLEPGEHLVGRDPAAHVWLDFASVSRMHARIVVGADGVRIEDRGSGARTAPGSANARSPSPPCSAMAAPS